MDRSAGAGAAAELQCWCSTTDSNRHRTDSKSVASASWASGAKWCQEKFTNGRDQPGQKRSLPETTVCRPTEGDQYRISGPSYVLAGTAILNSKTLHVITLPHGARGSPLAEFG